MQKLEIFQHGDVYLRQTIVERFDEDEFGIMAQIELFQKIVAAIDRGQFGISRQIERLHVVEFAIKRIQRGKSVQAQIGQSVIRTVHVFQERIGAQIEAFERVIGNAQRIQRRKISDSRQIGNLRARLSAEGDVRNSRKLLLREHPVAAAPPRLAESRIQPRKTGSGKVCSFTSTLSPSARAKTPRGARRKTAAPSDASRIKNNKTSNSLRIRDIIFLLRFIKEKPAVV